jgi:hypothetical protein
MAVQMKALSFFNESFSGGERKDKCILLILFRQIAGKKNGL